MYDEVVYGIQNVQVLLNLSYSSEVSVGVLVLPRLEKIQRSFSFVMIIHPDISE